MRTRSKLLFEKMTIVIGLAMALLLLDACALPFDQGPKESFGPAVFSLDDAGLYGLGESIEVGGIVTEGRVQSNGVEISLGYPSITRSTSLPAGVTVSDFRGGSFDESSFDAMKEQVGFAPDSEGKLPAGCSYVVVRETIENTTDGAVSYDVSKGRFILADETGGVSDVDADNPLWRNEWDGSDPKKYWIVSIDAGTTFDIELLYALSDDVIDADGLAYLVDLGNANGKEGFVGLKAFDVAGLVQE